MFNFEIPHQDNLSPPMRMVIEALGYVYKILRDEHSHSHCRLEAIQEFEDGLDRMIPQLPIVEVRKFRDIVGALKFIWMTMTCYSMNFGEAISYLNSPERNYN